MSRSAKLTKEALERWQQVPAEDKKKLLEDLESQPAGSVIELDEAEWVGNRSLQCKARVVAFSFGEYFPNNPKCRYLMKSQIPAEEKTLQENTPD